MSLVIEDWGVVPYRDALSKQLASVQKRLDGGPDKLIFAEHPPVYTLGRRKDAAKNLLLDETALAERGVELVETTRGGDITYHGPGQLVGYPIISLDNRRDLHRYLRDLEQVLINTLMTFGLAAARRDGLTGIWLENRKIAAIGVAVKRWVTYHGFALNVDLDLKAFTGIVPCGIAAIDGSVTNLAKELSELCPPIEEVKQVLASEFRAVFR